MANVTKRQVYYFDSPGEQNTSLVIEAVSQRLKDGGPKKVVVASTSGETALALARELKNMAEIICVSEAPYRRERGSEWPCLKPDLKKKLEKLGVAVIDKAPEVFFNSVMEFAPWGHAFPERYVRETLYTFGQGLKVAVEVALEAAQCGYVEPFEDVIGIGGMGTGADTAIICKATYPQCLFDKDPAKRLDIKEIIAMPVSKRWWE
jgi:uncharacterized protein